MSGKPQVANQLESSVEARESAVLGRLRAAALIAVMAGAVGSVGLMLRVGQNSDARIVVILIAGWVFAPFFALGVAHMASTSWSVPTRATLYGLTLVLTLGSLAAYLSAALDPSRAQEAAVFVVVPGVSWALIALVLPITAFTVGRRARDLADESSTSEKVVLN